MSLDILPGDATEEITALIRVLHRTGQRLEELTSGQVDPVADQHGQAFMLRHAHNAFRDREAMTQIAILNALPAQVAMLDRQGVVVGVNDAWRRFADANAMQGPEFGVGVNYLRVCDVAIGQDLLEAHRVAAGIRSVLGGEEKLFSMQYPCHSPTQRRWFNVTVAPLSDDGLGGVVVMHTDITQRDMDMQEDIATWQLLNNIVENIPTAVQLKSVKNDFRIQLWNKAAEAMYGLPRALAIGRNVSDLWPGAVGDRMHAADLQLLRDGGVQDFPDRTVVKYNGETLQAHLRKVALLDESGDATHLLVIADDMTVQLADQARLQESERRLSDLLDHVQLASVMLDADARITYCNEFLLRLTGWQLAEVIGRDWFDVFMPPELGDMRPVFLALLKDEPESWHRENEIYTRTRERRLIRWNNSVLRSEVGVVIGIASIGEDITEQRRSEANLLRFRAAMDAAADAIYLVDRARMRCIYVNDAACKLFNHTREDLLAIDPWVIASTSREALERSYDTVIESGEESKPIETARMRNDGTLEWIEVRRHAQRSGEQQTMVIIARDISERKEAALRIAHLNRVYAVLSGINTLIVRVRDPEELFSQASRVAVEAGGFRMAWIAVADPMTKEFAVAGSEGVSEDLLASINTSLRARESHRPEGALVAQILRRPEALVFNDLRRDSRHGFGKKHLAAGILSVAVLPLIVSGETLGLLVLCANEPDFFLAEEIKLLSELAGDVAFAMEHIERQERLDYLAYYDALTGLANRSLFLERLAQHMRGASVAGTQLALFLIDLERFKDINDSLGRPAGDTLLRQVVDWLKLNAGDTSSLARVGGDHFAILLPQVRKAGNVQHLLENAISAFVHHPFRLNDAVFRVAVKAGAAIFPADGADAETLFKNAEAALKKAKASGGPYLFYTHGMHARVAGRLTLESQLRDALQCEEFVLHYQPKLNAAGGKLAGAEALIRWMDPRSGLVPPGRFIPVLEDTGLIHEVGRWALRKAIADYLDWQRAGWNAMRIAVNVSALQLRHRDFIAEVTRAIEIDPQAAAGLELEITESVVMGDVKHSVSSLQAIRAMGVTVSIDDFGTGFSSLSYLSRLPVDALKIDRSFVADMTTGPQGLALVRTIIDLAHSMELKVVAEGVETEEQSRLLSVLGCDEFQGFLFSKALPREQFEKLFLAGPLR